MGLVREEVAKHGGLKVSEKELEEAISMAVYLKQKGLVR